MTNTKDRGQNIAALRRLAPYLRPVRGRMIGSATAVLASMVCGLAIPLVVQRILDGPVAEPIMRPRTGLR